MKKKLVSKWQSPQVTALDYDEFDDLMEHPDKAGHYNKLIKERTEYGKGFETKAPSKKKRRKAS